MFESKLSVKIKLALITMLNAVELSVRVDNSSLGTKLASALTLLMKFLLQSMCVNLFGDTLLTLILAIAHRMNLTLKT
jgi:hypothetical protein